MQSAHASELTILDYLRPVWRFKFVVLAVVVVAAGATYLYTRNQAPTYQASSDLYVGQSVLQQIINPTVSLTSRTVANEASLLTTPAVAEAVIKKLNLPYQPRELLKLVQANPSASEDFLTITAKSGSPQRAADIANGFAQAFIQLRNRDLVHDAKTALAQAQQQLDRSPGGSSSAAGKSSLEQEIATLQAEAVSPPSQGQQVNPASVPTVPVSPKPTRDAIFAGVIGFVLALIASYLLDRADRRVRGVEDVETLFDLPVLATIPFNRFAVRVADKLPIPSEALEPFRTLRVNLDIARVGPRGRVIMITSALPSEGKSAIVRNLALIYREAGSSVAVVEADLRRPVLAERFGVQGRSGLAEALSGERPLRMLEVPDLPGEPFTSGRIDLAVAGHSEENPSVLFTRGYLSQILDEVAESHDIVLLDSPPLLAVSDGLSLVRAVDGVLVVVRPGRATYPAATRLRSTVERLGGAPILGVVANGAEDELAGYAYGYYDKDVRNGASVAGDRVEAIPKPADDLPAI